MAAPVFICLDYSRALCAIIRRMSEKQSDPTKEIVHVARCYARSGAVYYIDKSREDFKPSALLVTGRAERIEDDAMTRAQYDAIPATQSAADFFDTQNSHAERPL